MGLLIIALYNIALYSVLQVSSATCHEGVVAQNEINPTPETKSPVCSHNEWDPLEVSSRNDEDEDDTRTLTESVSITL